jgi:hypothetical protein
LNLRGSVDITINKLYDNGKNSPRSTHGFSRECYSEWMMIARRGKNINVNQDEKKRQASAMHPTAPRPTPF